ncbi:MAG: hypothetical protein HY343_01340 [Lentisphaerae bacterium]|nr:hypothetical protein [Lentisphaerota bacterium]
MKTTADRYLPFVERTAELLWKHQRIPLAGNPRGTPFLVISSPPSAAWTSIALREDGHYDLYPIEERVLELKPTRIDLAAWAWLERLSDLVGNPVWRERVEAMAREFAVYGFDPRSGLAYLGQQAQFDVARLGPTSTSFSLPTFKPDDGIPLDRLWRHAALPMDRMFKSAYLGLVTRREDLSYNRFCYFGSDDRPGLPFMAFDPCHVAFGLTGALLIHWWVFHWRKTRSTQSLGWAQAMADKWLAAQHPETGLMPHWFGSDNPADTLQTPRHFANANDGAVAIVYLEVARLLRGETDTAAVALRDQLQRMGARLAVGMARFGYDEHERIFPNWLRVADGSVDRDIIYYAFPTQAMKDEAVRRDPRVAVASVNGGAALFPSGTASPYHLARAAELTGDTVLLARSGLLADHIMERAATLQRAPGEKGPGTCASSAGAARALLCLARATGDARYRAHAAVLLDRELDAIEQAPGEKDREWWRFPFRNALLGALLDLHETPPVE